MPTESYEPVTVGAVFRPGLIYPSWFLWHGRRYLVQAVTLRWQTREGRARTLHVAVTDGTTSYELTLNQETLTWCLNVVETSGSM